MSAKLVPSQPKENVCFMISLNYLEDWKDALSDDLGVWTPTGKRTLYYRRLLSINGKTNIQSVVSESDADVKAFRYLYCYPSCKDFKRIIIRVLSKTEVGWTSEPHLLIQYYFENGFKEITVPAHGNSKQKDLPYYRTKESTKQKTEPPVNFR